MTQHFVKLHSIILSLKSSQFMAGSNTRVKGCTFKLRSLRRKLVLRWCSWLNKKQEKMKRGNKHLSLKIENFESYETSFSSWNFAFLTNSSASSRFALFAAFSESSESWSSLTLGFSSGSLSSSSSFFAVAFLDNKVQQSWVEGRTGR